MIPRPAWVRSAIPGGPLGGRGPATAPTASPYSIDRAIGLVNALAVQLAADRMWPMIEPLRATAAWDDYHGHLRCVVWLPMVRAHAYQPLWEHRVELSYGVLCHYSDGWYEPGWIQSSPPYLTDAAAARLLEATVNEGLI